MTDIRIIVPLAEPFSGELSAPGVTGTIAHDETITITAQGAEDFGTKPDPFGRGNAKPLMVWRADDQSLLPNTTLGNVSSFISALAGDFVTSPKAVNSSYALKSSLGWDNNQAAHFKFNFSTDWQNAYVFTRHLHNFDDDTGKHYRMRIKSGDYTNISVGDWARSRTSPNATGQVSGSRPSDGSVNTIGVISFENDVGSISYLNEEEDFGGAGDHTIDFYATQAEAESGIGTILETVVENEGGVSGSAPFRTLNNKQCRHGSGASTFYSIDNSGGAAVSLSGLSEPNYPKSSWTNGSEPSFGYQKDTWVHAETLTDMGTLDTQDGIYAVYRDGILAFDSSKKFMLLESGINTESFDRHSQQSADAGQLDPSADVLTDYVYCDDSWYYVLVTDEPLVLDSTVNTTKREHQPCPPTAWASGSVSCVLQQGQHDSFFGKYINVVVDGVVETTRLIS